MNEKTVGDINKEIRALRMRINVLENERFELIYTGCGHSNAWRDTCDGDDVI